MTDIISFDVELTQNQKLAQDKLNQVHQLYDEIEKVLGTQGVFKRPHLFMALPKKEPQTNEEWLCGLSTEEKAKFLRQIYRDGRDDYVGEWYEQTESDFVEWLKQPHTIKE